MELRNLLDGFIGENVDVTGITSDSRQVKKGYLFVALPSLRGGNINDHIKEALKKGASVIITQPDIRFAYDSYPINFIASDNPRKDLARIASKWYEKVPEHCVAVTGTNGKTSVVEFVRQFWMASNFKGVSIGTLGVRDSKGEIIREGSLTSPETLLLHEILNDLAENKVTHVALEASSHGLDQYRLDEVPLQAAAFTNFSQDHLDYHGDMRSYFDAKLRLFRELLPTEATAILNADVPEYAPLLEVCEKRNLKCLTYGKKASDLKLLDVVALNHGQKLYLEIQNQKVDVHLPLIGRFQAMNVLCAAGLCLATGVELKTIIESLQKLKPVPGRVEFVGKTKSGGTVYVDYAHTPDALMRMLEAVRSHSSENKLVVVFGCGGDRDVTKRFLMGQIASELADQVIVTDDNPRTEDPAQIRQAILNGCPKAEEIGNRKEAIEKGINALEAGDILVVAGKGHEVGQIIGAEIHPFSDVDVIQSFLQEDTDP